MSAAGPTSPSDPSSVEKPHHHHRKHHHHTHDDPNKEHHHHHHHHHSEKEKTEEVTITATASAQVGSQPQVYAATPVVVNLPPIDTKPAQALTEQKIIKEMQEPAPIPAPQVTPLNAPKEPVKKPTLSELAKEYVPGARLFVEGALTPLFKMHSKAGNDWVNIIESVRQHFGTKPVVAADDSAKAAVKLKV